MIAATMIASSPMVQAQIWCPPGAVWEYNFMGGPSIGCEIRTYVGDTLIDGFVCQRIEVTDIIYDFIDEDIDTIVNVLHTREANGVVFEQLMFGAEWQWDTLYWFAAPVGARWYPPGVGDGCDGSAGMVEVLSMEEQVINGLSLEVRTLGQLGVDGEVMFEGPEMIERIGTPLMSIPHTCVFGNGFGSTLSYSDDLWAGYESEEPSNCDSFNSIQVSARQQDRLVLFDEGDGRLRLVWSAHVPGSVIIYDRQGRVVHSEATLINTPVVNVAHMASGLYTLEVWSADGNRAFANWVKP